MKAIAGFECYTISRDGQVTNTRTGRVLKFDITNMGYRRVTLSMAGKFKRIAIHRLVALHYLPNPEGTRQVNHKDGDKLNNHVENLEWVTCSENRLHAHRTGLARRGENHQNTNLTDKTVNDVCSLIAQGFRRKEILSQYPEVSKYQFDDIRRKRTWVHISKAYCW